MDRPAQDAIDMFMSITGTSKAVAVQKLEEFGGDLNAAVNSHFNQGDNMNSSTVAIPAPRSDLMDIDDPFSIATAAPALPPFPAIRRLNPFSILESHFGRSLFDGGTPDFANEAPRVSHPRDVREIPIEFKDEISHSGSSGSGPKIEDVTGNVSANETVVHGTVIIDDEDEDLSILPADLGANHSVGVSARRQPTTNATPLADVTDYTDDIEEEMIQAAIEASKREAEEYGKQQYDVSDSVPNPKLNQDSFVLDDSDLAHAVSLSLKTAERESVLRAHGLAIGEQSSNASDSRPENFRRLRVANGRQRIERSKSQTSNQSNMEEGDPSFEDEVDDADEEPLVRHRSIPATSGNAPRQIILSPPSSPQRQEVTRHAQNNGDAFQSDEWGGISSEEHDEAVMLEAAIFGGIPEGTSYHFEYPRHQVMPSNYDSAPHAPSPRLAEQRMLREQQDDEYFASLQADREKELKAMQETEKRRLEEAAAVEAAFKREKHQEEEAYRKQLEEEEFERKLAAKQASLPQEPSVDNENSVTLLIRMPDGSRCGRRFLKSDKLQLLFDYLDVGRLVKPDSYRLVRPYPRRSFTDEESQLSLSELGLTSKQEALFLELI
ncbi:plant UBX domain-containing protein 8 isoform X1 [Dendrobium catenatum]|uniref:plant UBX domain-containing protein 8 isoform X1 n=2 Tax=Dendrobium catenatum TaxID=906689 RepID=UPI0009F35A45|nr:plant UBX domain-containing protein 8 isoform X1 [Dendrobium catenatum]